MLAWLESTAESSTEHGVPPMLPPSRSLTDQERQVKPTAQIMRPCAACIYLLLSNYRSCCSQMLMLGERAKAIHWRARQPPRKLTAAERREIQGRLYRSSHKGRSEGRLYQSSRKAKTARSPLRSKTSLGIEARAAAEAAAEAKAEAEADTGMAAMVAAALAEAEAEAAAEQAEAERVMHQAAGEAVAQVQQIDGSNDQRDAERALAELKEIITSQLQRIISLFHTWDVDQNGRISRQELHRAIRGLGIVTNKEAINSLFDAIDTDGEGSIQYEELKTAINAPGLLQRPSPPPPSSPLRTPVKGRKGKSKGTATKSRSAIVSKPRQKKSARSVHQSAALGEVEEASTAGVEEAEAEAVEVVKTEVAEAAQTVLAAEEEAAGTMVAAAKAAAGTAETPETAEGAVAVVALEVAPADAAVPAEAVVAANVAVTMLAAEAMIPEESTAEAIPVLDSSTGSSPGSLPVGWYEAAAPDGTPYYYEPQSGAVSWERPPPPHHRRRRVSDEQRRAGSRETAPSGTKRTSHHGLPQSHSVAILQASGGGSIRTASAATRALLSGAMPIQLRTSTILPVAPALAMQRKLALQPSVRFGKRGCGTILQNR